MGKGTLRSFWQACEQGALSEENAAEKGYHEGRYKEDVCVVFERQHVRTEEQTQILLKVAAGLGGYWGGLVMDGLLPLYFFEDIKIVAVLFMSLFIPE